MRPQSFGQHRVEGQLQDGPRHRPRVRRRRDKALVQTGQCLLVYNCNLRQKINNMSTISN